MKTPLPAPRAEVAAVAFDGKLHALGGSVNGVAGPYHDEYDPATDNWRPAHRYPKGAIISLWLSQAARFMPLVALPGAVHKGAGTDAFEYDPPPTHGTHYRR